MGAFARHCRTFYGGRRCGFRPTGPTRLFLTSGSLVTIFPGRTSCGLLVRRDVRRLGLTSSRMRRLHSGVGRLTSALPRCTAMVNVCNIKGAFNPRLVTRVNSVSGFSRHRTLATFTKMSPNISRSNARGSGDGGTSGYNSGHLEGALFRVVSALLRATPRSSGMCRFLIGGHTRKGPCCICVATKTGGFLHVCCNGIGRYVHGLRRWPDLGSFFFGPTGVTIRGLYPGSRSWGWFVLLLAFC